MPLKNFKNIGELQRYEYQRGKITGVNTENDTCNLTLKEAVLSGEEITYNDKTYSNVPIYYHCNPDVEEQANGSLKGAGAAFMEDDDVVVLIERGKDAEKIFVVARIGEKRHCSIGMVVIISTQSEMEAFAWDIENNKLVVATTTLSVVQSKLETNGIELVPSGSVDDVWERPTSYYSEYDAAMNLPILINGDYEDDGLYEIDTIPYPAVPEYNQMGNISQWSFTHYYIENPFDENADKKAPYIIMLYGESELEKHDEYIELTGCVYPSDVDPFNWGNPYRQYLFWNSVFGYNMDGEQCLLENLQTITEEMYDSWVNGIWYPAYENDICDCKPVAPYKSSGIAKIENKAVIFEHFGLCVNWDTFTSECSSSDDYSSLLRLYVRNDDVLPAGLAKSCFDAVNDERALLAIPELVLNTILVKTAERHLADLVEHFISMSSNGTAQLPHTGSDSSTPFTRATDLKYNLWLHEGLTYTIGENIHYHWGQDESIDHVSMAIEGWRASTQGHWEMLTNQDMTETGTAHTSFLAELEEGVETTVHIFVQVFGVRQEIWAGFSPVDTTEIKAYMEETFTFTNEGDNTRVPKVYLT